jgi:hypothetical protein
MKKKKYAFDLRMFMTAGFVLALLAFSAHSSHAFLYTENFSSATGTSPTLAIDQFSEKWSPTTYYIGGPAVLTGWTFSGQAYLAQNGTDKAILLNEGLTGGYQRSEMITSIGGLSVGQNYVLTFDYWGDNRPGQTYSFVVKMAGTTVGSSLITGSYTVSGNGTVAYIPFTATGTTMALTFMDATTSGQASAIIDNVSVSSVPIPSALLLISSGLVGLIAIRRRHNGGKLFG